MPPLLVLILQIDFPDWRGPSQSKDMQKPCQTCSSEEARRLLPTLTFRLQNLSRSQLLLFVRSILEESPLLKMLPVLSTILYCLHHMLSFGSHTWLMPCPKPHISFKAELLQESRETIHDEIFKRGIKCAMLSYLFQWGSGLRPLYPAHASPLPQRWQEGKWVPCMDSIAQMTEMRSCIHNA